VVTVPSIAIEAYVVTSAVRIPTGFEVLRSTIDGGVPARIDLRDSWSLVLHVPTGAARTWLDADPQALVASSALESDLPSAGDRVPAPARLMVIRDGTPIGAIPLAIGMSTRIATTTPTSSLLEVIPIAWEIRAAALIGGAAGGVRIELAWVVRSAVGP
jgi:hypothetical protein